jgi:outer membrane lipoprotein-sorting protein
MRRRAPKSFASRLARAGLTTIAAWLLLAGGTVAAQETLDGSTILQRAEDAEQYDSLYTEMRQLITTSSGAQRTLVLRSWAIDSGERQLAEYLEPADVHGQKILMTDDGDNIWMFNPETRRTRRIGSHMRNRRVMGSDFTYEDEAMTDLTTKFTGELVRTELLGGVPCYVVRMTPTDAGPSYDAVLGWFGVDDFLCRRLDFYQDGDSEPRKRLTFEDFREVSGRVMAHRLTMTNLRDRTSTLVEVTRAVYGEAIPESIFESRNLE